MEIKDNFNFTALDATSTEDKSLPAASKRIVSWSSSVILNASSSKSTLLISKYLIDSKWLATNPVLESPQLSSIADIRRIAFSSLAVGSSIKLSSKSLDSNCCLAFL